MKKNLFRVILACVMCAVMAVSFCACSTGEKSSGGSDGLSSLFGVNALKEAADENAADDSFYGDVLK